MLGHHPVLSQEEFESAESQSASSDSTHNSIEKTIEEQDDSDSHSKLSADDSSSDSEPTYSPTDLAAMKRAARITRDIRMRHLEMLAHYAEAQYENRIAPEDMGLYGTLTRMARTHTMRVGCTENLETGARRVALMNQIRLSVLRTTSLNRFNSFSRTLHLCTLVSRQVKGQTLNTRCALQR